MEARQETCNRSSFFRRETRCRPALETSSCSHLLSMHSKWWEIRWPPRSLLWLQVVVRRLTCSWAEKSSTIRRTLSSERPASDLKTRPTRLASYARSSQSPYARRGSKRFSVKSERRWCRGWDCATSSRSLRMSQFHLCCRQMSYLEHRFARWLSTLTSSSLQT